MHVHPEIAALRGDKPMQRRILSRMQAARAEWLNRPEVEALRRDMEQYGAGGELGQCRSLAQAISDPDKGLQLVDGWRRILVAALKEEPLGEQPYDYRCSAGFSRIQLLRVGRATLSVVAYERREESATTVPQSVLFEDNESHELALAGSAQTSLHQLEETPGGAHILKSRSTNWKAGGSIVCRDASASRQVLKVNGALLVLQLSRPPERPKPSREVRLSDGKVIQTASGNKAASQRLMALAVLGASGHDFAIGAMTERALDPSEDTDVRWEAVRQALAMDVQQGMALLSRLGVGEEGDLQRAAIDLERRLLATRPDLAHFLEEAA